jgi:hypothetical protein
MKRYLTWLFLPLICVILLNCSTDDVDGELPTPGAEKVQIPDAAFGEYMFFNEVPGITEEFENNQVNYYLDPDEVITVSELSLSKTSGNIETLNEAGVVTADVKITDLTGIEYFEGLQVLNLTSNDLTSIDLTNLSGLEDLGLNFNLIGELDVTQNPNLTSLRCVSSSQAEDNQKMTSIDLSNNSELRELILRNHEFVTIDLSNNLQIDQSIDMSGNPGPDGDPDTGDIIIPAAIYDQLGEADRIGVISDADVVTTVLLSTQASSIPEDNGEAIITVALNQATDVPVEVNLDFAGDATVDTDFTISNQPVTIPAGELQTTFTLTAIQDNDIEGDETLTINLGSITNAEAGENQEISLIIEDDDFEVPLILNEILYDPPSELDGDANNDGVRDPNEDEFIELYNKSDSPLDISGFQVYDSEALDTDTSRHIIPEGTVLPPNSAIVIFGGGTPTGTFGGSIVQTATGGLLNLNNAGDVLTIKDNDGITVITFDIEPLSNNPDESYTRSPDITGDFVQHAGVSNELFSPGTQINGSSF